MVEEQELGLFQKTQEDQEEFERGTFRVIDRINLTAPDSEAADRGDGLQ